MCLLDTWPLVNLAPQEVEVYFVVYIMFSGISSIVLCISYYYSILVYFFLILLLFLLLSLLLLFSLAQIEESAILSNWFNSKNCY